MRATTRRAEPAGRRRCTGAGTGSEPAARRGRCEVRGLRYEHEVYDGAGHGFLRDQAGRDGANAQATLKAWPRTLAFLKQQLE